MPKAIFLKKAKVFMNFNDSNRVCKTQNFRG